VPRNVILVLLGAWLLSGCAPQMERIETGVNQNAGQIAEIRAELRQLRQEQQVVSELLRIEQDAGVETDAQRGAKITQLSTKIDQLMQKLDDNAEFMRSLSARVDLLATRAGVPTLGEYKPPPTAPRGQELEPLSEEGRAIFQAAELDRSRGNTALAREGFQEFLARYGRSELADDALYWLGDLAYGEGRYDEALAFFLDLLKRFPATDRAPAAMLKAAYSLQELNRSDESRRMFEQLRDTYPASAEAALAAEQLVE
jgi:tol-pal system protein YbgF